MATFVIVHGAWGGGWEWRSVADALAARGHRTFTPTLTGLGERSHLLSRSIGLHTHAEDVAQLIRWERARDVLLVGHSYGGMVTTMAASMIEDVKAMIYVDAFTPEPGQCEIDLLDPEWAESMLLEPARHHGDGWLVPFPFPEDLDGYPADVAARYRTARQPLATFTDPADVDPRVRTLPTAFIHCTGKPPGEDVFAGIAREAEQRGWLIQEIASGHDIQIEQPTAIAQVLHDLAPRL
jgi:pimeloyl-ACP methyl ester carboxylesterase